MAKSLAPNESYPIFRPVNVSPNNAFLDTLFIRPPVPPLPNKRALGPLRTST